MPEFPTIVYRIPGKYRGPGPLTHDFKGVASQDDLNALGDGWSESIPAAMDAYEAKLQAQLNPPKKRGRPRKKPVEESDADPS